MEHEAMITTYETILWILGGIITIGGASAVIARWIAPFRKLKEEVKGKATAAELEMLEKRVNELLGSQCKDHDKLQDVETGNEKICKCVLAIINHELTGNSVDKMREARDEMQNYLIQK